MSEFGQIIDFADARRRLALQAAAIQANRESDLEQIRRRLAEARRRLVREANSLPLPWREVALEEAHSVTEFTRDWPGLGLREFERCRRNESRHAAEGPDWGILSSLARLHHAIGRLRVAKKSGQRSMIIGARRSLTSAKRQLLGVLFAFGRRRIARSERPSLAEIQETIEGWWGSEDRRHVAKLSKRARK
jgi:hypothetical protein